jgi:hypothetical protein
MKEYLNKVYYDCRYEDYYTITEIEETQSATYFYISYHKKIHLNKKENSSFIIYHINAKQHLPSRYYDAKYYTK